MSRSAVICRLQTLISTTYAARAVFPTQKVHILNFQENFAVLILYVAAVDIH